MYLSWEKLNRVREVSVEISGDKPVSSKGNPAKLFSEKGKKIRKSLMTVQSAHRIVAAYDWATALSSESRGYLQACIKWR